MRLPSETGQAPDPGPVFVPAGPKATNPIDSDGVARGCRLPGSVEFGVPGIGGKDLGGLIPAWVRATESPNQRVHGERPFVLEGRVTSSHNSREDFPLRPWHTSYDWNFFVKPDPQYRNLLSTLNGPTIECEWEEAFFPAWARPWGKHRVWVMGRWIFDCGHPDAGQYRTEIHPPRAVATFVPGAVRLPGNAARTRVMSAVVFIGRRGGYFDTPINDTDYEFTFALPPRPTGVAGAVPRTSVRAKTPLSVPPEVTIIGRTAVHVRIPLKGVNPHPEEYGVIISAGWSDPDGIAAREIVQRKVSLEKFSMDANLDPIGADEWYAYFGVNGNWWDFKSLSGASKQLRRSVTLHLHRDERIEVSVSGFEADTVHDFMGKATGVQPEEVMARTTNDRTKQIAKTVVNAMGFHLNQNDKLEPVVASHRATETGTFTVVDSKRDYKLRYTIS